MPGFDHLAALAAVPRRSRSTPCALAARPVIVNALSVALPYPLTALPTHLVVLPPHCPPAVPTVSRGSSRSPCPSCSHACSLSSRQSMRFRGWIMAYSHACSRLPAGQTLPGCRAVPLRPLAVSRFRHHLPAVGGLGAHGRRSRHCLRAGAMVSRLPTAAVASSWVDCIQNRLLPRHLIDTS